MVGFKGYCGLGFFGGGRPMGLSGSGIRMTSGRDEWSLLLPLGAVLGRMSA